MVARRKKTRTSDSFVATQSDNTNVLPSDLEFEKLVSEISAGLIRVTVDEIDNEVEQWLGRVVLAMDIERSTIVQVDLDDGAIYTTHQWGRAGIPTPEKGHKVDDTSSYPWLTRKVLTGEVVVISRLNDLPEEASKDRESFRRDGNQSNLTIPLRVGGVVVGAALFGTLNFEKQWSEHDINRLQLVAEIFGNAFERKRAEAQIRQLSEELRQVSQVVTMGELTASLAHELNQPLGAILNYARAVRRMLAAENPDLAKIDGALAEIIRDDARAVEIVRHVGTLFRRDEAKIERVDIGQLFVDVVQIVSATAKMKHILLATEADTSLPVINGNRLHFTQVLLNLLFNAFDAVCESGAQREVTLSAIAGPNEVRLSVRDSGKGIDPVIAPRIFEPFFTTKATGMGMGLAIVRSIIENHGGEIRARPNRDQGTTFELTLPIAQAVARTAISNGEQPLDRHNESSGHRRQ
jgi:signal transduction histidine kinase